MNIKFIKHFIKGCGVCSVERSGNYHYHISPFCYGSSDNIKTALLIFDFPTRTQLAESELIIGHTGQLYKEIIKLVLGAGYYIEMLFAIPCFKEVENTKITALDVHSAHETLVTEPALYKADLIITFGKPAISVLVGKDSTIKEFRHRLYQPKGSNVKISSTFSPMSAIVDPKNAQIILKDVDWILSKSSDVQTEALELDYNMSPRQSLFDGVNPKYFALDVETEGFNSFLKDKRLLTLAICFEEAKAYGWNYNHPDEVGKQSFTAYNPIKKMLQNPYAVMVGHNIKFDYLWLKNKFFSNIKCQLYDTKIAYNLLDENAPDNTLKAFSAIFTDLPAHYEDGIDASKLAETPVEQVLQYNMMDADATFRIFNILDKKCEEAGKKPLLDFLNKTLKTLADIELRGVYCDRKFSDESAVKYGKQLIEQERLLAGYGLTKGKKTFSNNDIANILHKQLGLPIIAVTESGEPSVASQTISDLLKLDNLTQKQIDFLVAYQGYKKASKVYTTYFEKLDNFIASDGRIHTSYNLGKSSSPVEESGTVTGRLSSKDPNLQNIPRSNDVRGCFSATPGYFFIDADYSQLELRIAAYLAQERLMYNIFGKGDDLHTSVLANMIKRDYNELVLILKDDTHKEYNYLKQQRVVAKSINFGILYGMGASLLQETSRQNNVKMDRAKAQAMIDAWLNGFPKIKKWIHKTQEQARTTGIVSSPTGRDRHLPGANRQDPVGFGQLRQAINFPIQTLASEVCLAALNICQDYFEHNHMDVNIVLTVHDSILFECHNKYKSQVDRLLDKVKTLMTTGVTDYFFNQFGFNIDVPLEVSVKVGDRWTV